MSTDTIHVVPLADLVDHDTTGLEPCICGPDTEAVVRDDGSNGWLVTHHSLDGREHIEVVIEALLTHAREEAPHECVGLIADDHAGRPTAFPLTNVAADPEHNFEVTPQQLHEAMVEMDRDGYELRAIYHSHPSSPAVPSPTDIRFAAGWPGIQWVIASLTDEPQVRAWSIDGDQVTELAGE